MGEKGISPVSARLCGRESPAENPPGAGIKFRVFDIPENGGGEIRKPFAGPRGIVQYRTEKLQQHKYRGERVERVAGTEIRNRQGKPLVKHVIGENL